MNRLTKKRNGELIIPLCRQDLCNGEYQTTIATYELLGSYKKLSKLEDLEEQLGCPLEVREKAFDNGFYDVKGNHYFCEHYVPYLKSMHTRGIMNRTYKSFMLKDYKKTWWLKENLEE